MRAKPSINYLLSGTNPEANGDYTSTPGYFEFGPPAGEDFVVHDFDVVVIDSLIHPEGYGANATPLGTGVEIYWTIDGETIPIGTGAKVTNNRSWMVAADHIVLLDIPTGAPTDAMLRCRVSVGNFFHDPDIPKEFNGFGGILLQGHRGDKITVKVVDDLTFLTHHLFLVRGGRYLDWISARNAG